MKGRISFNRTNHDVMHLSLVDDATHIEIVRLEMALSDFALMITGQGHLPCTFTIRGEHLGKIVEQKEVNVPYAGYAGYDRSPDAVQIAFASFEVDGWHGRVSDLLNMHRRTKDGYCVLFTRYVPVQETEGK